MKLLMKYAYRSQKLAARRTEKRPSSYFSSNQKYCALGGQKAMAIERNSRCKQFVGKVNDTLHNGFSEIEKSNVNGFFQCSIEESSNSNLVDSSIASCSITNNDLNKSCSGIRICPSEDTNSYCSNAGSCWFSGNTEEESSFSSVAELDANFHKLELDSYRGTLRELFASGSVTWENDELLTNLRLSLHISNDEHLMEIKNLISARSYLWTS